MNRVPKRLQLRKNPSAYNIFLKTLDDFRELQKKTKWHKMPHYVDFFTPKRKKIFIEFVNDLEEFRCHAIGMKNLEVFYKLCAEFILVPNGRAYYNPIHLFGGTANFEAEEFRNRVFETMTYIFSVVGDGFTDNEKTYEFVEKVNQLKNVVEFRGVSPVFLPKAWYCIKTIHRRAESKGWTLDELVNKIKVFYRHRIRKVYPEMLLHDFVHGELDGIGFNKEKPKKRKLPRHIQAINDAPWTQEWLKNQLPDD